MDDQPFAGKHLQSWRRVEIAARPLSVGRCASDHLIVEKQNVLDGRNGRIEPGLALPCRKANFEDALLARQRYRLSEFWSNCGICSCRGSLPQGSRARKFKRHQDGQGSDCQRTNEACAERVLERNFVHEKHPVAVDSNYSRDQNLILPLRGTSTSSWSVLRFSFDWSRPSSKLQLRSRADTRRCSKAYSQTPCTPSVAGPASTQAA